QLSPRSRLANQRSCPGRARAYPPRARSQQLGHRRSEWGGRTTWIEENVTCLSKEKTPEQSPWGVPGEERRSGGLGATTRPHLESWTRRSIEISFKLGSVWLCDENGDRRPSVLGIRHAFASQARASCGSPPGDLRERAGQFVADPGIGPAFAAGVSFALRG